jgi:hypothetical protein
METASAGTASGHASGAQRPATVTLEAGSSYRRATALRLSAPSAGALQGTTLGGVALRGNGTLPTPRSAALADANGEFTVELQPASATLVTLSPRAG